MKNIVSKYLNQNLYNDLVEGFEDFFQSHPNYPSLYAITDTFTLLSIENVAVKIPKEQITELPNNFLAVFKNELVLVNKTNSKIQIENQDLKKKEVNYSDFLENWNGIIIAIEPNTKIATISTKKSSLWLFYMLPFMALISLSVYFNVFTFYSFTALFVSLIGIVASIFILQEKFGVQNEIASKFCNINANTSCNSVIKSEKSSKKTYLAMPIIMSLLKHDGPL
jgi:RNA polymerase subunit RPABC4/transcription elongation factor Spt4